MNPDIIKALLDGQGGQQMPGQMPGMGGSMPGQGMPQGMPMPGMQGGMSMPGMAPPRRWEGNRPLTLAELDKMKQSGQGLPSDWMSKLAPNEYMSLMPTGTIY